MMSSDAADQHFFQQFRAELGFELDEFQIRACQAVEDDHGVLVCAPTGAGKTIVGEFAVALALWRGTKCFYTTPIKALSNQKYHDLVRTHGQDAVGLLTGDVSINPGADIVVMTTEVLRNMIYAESPALDRLTHVVMDEIHFLADPSRGPVWEEIILNLAESVNIIGLSATVSNSEEFGQWLATVRGETTVIVSEERPVPLRQWMLVNKRLFPLFSPDGETIVNPALEAKVDALEKVAFEQGKECFQPIGRPEVLRILQSHAMLPAITFIFSRAGCDAALLQCLRSKLVLTTDAQAQEIDRIIAEGVEGIPEADLKVLRFNQWRAALMRGFAAHHAGMLPAFRHIVEKLFTKGLVQAVFATETLALGINMPARTVVLEKLVKFNGESHADLTPGQYTQLTGRAGRRGIDTQGNAVVQWSPAVDPHAVAGLASTRTYPLVSTFTPGYNMSVNLLATIGYHQSHSLLEKSFAQYQTDRRVVGTVRESEKAQARVRELEQQLRAGLPPQFQLEDFLAYIQLRYRLKQEEKQARRRAIDERDNEVRAVLRKLQPGAVIAMPGRKKPLLAVVVAQANNPRDPMPWIVMEKGWSGRVDTESFAAPPIVVGEMKLPRDVTHHPRRAAKSIAAAFRHRTYPRPKKIRTKPRHRDNAQITQLREQLRSHPAHKLPEREELARIAEKFLRRSREVKKLRTEVSQATDTLGKTFDRIMDLLAEMDYVEFVADSADPERSYPRITEEGQRLALLHNESDLLVAQCLRRGIWDHLDPAELAGVVSTCCFENRKETRKAPGMAAGGASVAMDEAMRATVRIWEELAFDERRHDLPMTRAPEGGFALAIHQWAAGAPLGYCMAAAAQSGAELTPGDFVRWCRQVVDLLEQVKKTGYSDEVRHAARQAIDAIRRGVVAIGT